MSWVFFFLLSKMNKQTNFFFANIFLLFDCSIIMNGEGEKIAGEKEKDS